MYWKQVTMTQIIIWFWPDDVCGIKMHLEINPYPTGYRYGNFSDERSNYSKRGTAKNMLVWVYGYYLPSFGRLHLIFFFFKTKF